jgi:hypothetical protein
VKIFTTEKFMRKGMLPLVMGLIASSLWACTQPPAKEALKIEQSSAESVKATVEAIDMQTRMVTIRGPKGNSMIVHADEKMVNLPQVRVGDEIVLVYVQSVTVRMAEPGEIRDESSRQVGRAKPGGKPGVARVSESIDSARIEAVDKMSETLRLRMLDGSLRIVKVEDPVNLEKIRIGDAIVITSTEAMAFSVHKAGN